MSGLTSSAFLIPRGFLSAPRLPVPTDLAGLEGGCENFFAAPLPDAPNLFDCWIEGLPRDDFFLTTAAVTFFADEFSATWAVPFAVPWIAGLLW